MKTKVMYHSKSGNTRKVAEAIAQAIGEIPEAIPSDYPLENVALLFLGAGSYGSKVDKKMIDFIGTLNTSRVKNVALFGTSSGKDTHLNHMRELLKAKGINVIEETYCCKGKSFIFLNRKSPTSDELEKAKEFATAVYKKLDK